MYLVGCYYYLQHVNCLPELSDGLVVVFRFGLPSGPAMVFVFAMINIVYRGRLKYTIHCMSLRNLRFSLF